MSFVSVHNEWDPLEEIIVGSAMYASMPIKDKGFQVLRRSSQDLFEALLTGPLPEKIISETEEDIQTFINELLKLNIKVKRPESISFSETFKTLYWEAEHYFCYCPRDILLTIGETIIETPNVFRSRYFESFAYKKILLNYMLNGSKWLSAPKPKLTDDIYNEYDPTQLALRNVEPVFDAANVLRAGKDIFYLVSDSGNELGYQWLQTVLGPTYKVHPCYDLYSSMHIDSTVSLLRPGLVLVNPSRVSKKNLPKALTKWDVIYAPEMVEYNYSQLGSFSTPWLGMNLLMIRPDLAVVDKHQLPLIKLLEKNNINVLPLLLRHGRTLGGGFHCITLDVRRKGQLEDYFS